MDSFVKSGSRYEVRWFRCPFWTNPLPFAHALLSARRRGQEFSHSQMGRLAQGIAPRETDFEGHDEGGEEMPMDEDDDASLLERNPEKVTWEMRN